MSKVIIVTGASKGIGLATAQSLLKEGHSVFLVARTEEPLKKLKDEFSGRVDYFVGDLADFEVCVCVSPVVSLYSRGRSSFSKALSL